MYICAMRNFMYILKYDKNYQIKLKNKIKFYLGYKAAI